MKFHFEKKCCDDTYGTKVFMRESSLRWQGQRFYPPIDCTGVCNMQICVYFDVKNSVIPRVGYAWCFDPRSGIDLVIPGMG